MSNIVRDEYFVKSDIDENNNKFWRIKIYDDDAYTTENGRVGNSPQTRPLKHDGKYEALIRSKVKKGYIKQETEGIIEGGVTTTSVTASGLEDLAVKQINTDSPDTVKLIKWLTKINVHKIQTNTTISYDEQSGIFKTPIDTIVSQNTIDTARTVLNDLAEFVTDGDFENNELKSLLNQYLALIPQKVPRKLSTRLYENQDELNKQFDILDSLESSISTWKTTPKTVKGNKVTEEKIFATKLHRLTNDKEFKRIEDKYMSTVKTYHQSSRLRLKRVFCMEIEHEKKAFDDKGIKTGNLMELWHGTSSSNLLSIMKGGLIIPKSSSGHVTGRMYSDGLYFSNEASKSLNYADGYWGGNATSGSRYMFLADVAMGKYFVPTGPTSKLPPKGYDSYFAKGRQSGVQNNEMIVFNLHQASLKYLCEFS